MKETKDDVMRRIEEKFNRHLDGLPGYGDEVEFELPVKDIKHERMLESLIITARRIISGTLTDE